MARIACAATLFLYGLVLLLPGYAQDIPQTFICGPLTGTTFDARTWSSEVDGTNSQQVLLDFKGEKPGSNVKWYRDGKAHHESFGLGVPMKAGFAILIVADDYVESYVFVSETFELLFSRMRWGSSVLPNTIKSLRGICTPAGYNGAMSYPNKRL